MRHSLGGGRWGRQSCCTDSIIYKSQLWYMARRRKREFIFVVFFISTAEALLAFSWRQNANAIKRTCCFIRWRDPSSTPLGINTNVICLLSLDFSLFSSSSGRKKRRLWHGKIEVLKSSPIRFSPPYFGCCCCVFPVLFLSLFLSFFSPTLWISV